MSIKMIEKITIARKQIHDITLRYYIETYNDNVNYNLCVLQLLIELQTECGPH